MDHDPHLSVGSVGLCMLVQVVGYWIFRSANSQKDAFRRDPTAPEVAHLSYLETKRGTRLITRCVCVCVCVCVCSMYVLYGSILVSVSPSLLTNSSLSFSLY